MKMVRVKYIILLILAVLALLCFAVGFAAVKRPTAKADAGDFTAADFTFTRQCSFYGNDWTVEYTAVGPWDDSYILAETGQSGYRVNVNAYRDKVVVKFNTQNGSLSYRYNARVPIIAEYTYRPVDDWGNKKTVSIPVDTTSLYDIWKEEKTLYSATVLQEKYGSKFDEVNEYLYERSKDLTAEDIWFSAPTVLNNKVTFRLNVNGACYGLLNGINATVHGATTQTLQWTPISGGANVYGSGVLATNGNNRYIEYQMWIPLNKASNELYVEVSVTHKDEYGDIVETAAGSLHTFDLETPKYSLVDLWKQIGSTRANFISAGFSGTGADTAMTFIAGENSHLLQEGEALLYTEYETGLDNSLDLYKTVWKIVPKALPFTWYFDYMTYDGQGYAKTENLGIVFDIDGLHAFLECHEVNRSYHLWEVNFNEINAMEIVVKSGVFYVRLLNSNTRRYVVSDSNLKAGRFYAGGFDLEQEELEYLTFPAGSEERQLYLNNKPDVYVSSAVVVENEYVDSLNARISELEADKLSLQQTILNLNGTIDTLQVNISLKEETIRRLTTEKVELQADNAELETSLESEQRKYSALLAEYNTVKAERDSLQAELNETKAVLEAVRTSLSGDNSELLNLNVVYRNERDAANEKNKGLEEENARLTEELNKAQETIDTLSKDFGIGCKSDVSGGVSMPLIAAVAFMAVVIIAVRIRGKTNDKK